MKDPAFLFYSRDFYEGTRMMLPEERACYIDLLIFQHQNGFIPNDPKRLRLYCSGIDEATLQATLEAKFKLTDQGWYNEKLQNIILERENYKGTQSENGKIGQFMKKAKAILSQKDYNSLVSLRMEKADIIDFMANHKIEKSTLEALLKRCLSNKEDANANAITNEDVEENIILGATSKKNKSSKKEDEEFIPSEHTLKIMGYFNTITGRQLDPLESREKMIKALVKKKYTDEDFAMVIKYKFNEWKDNEECSKYIRPETLFQLNRFPVYLEAAKMNPPKREMKMVY